MRLIILSVAAALTGACASASPSGQVGTDRSPISGNAPSPPASASPQIVPPALGQPSMVYDSERHQLVLFGGSGDRGYSGTTYTWNANRWQLAASSGPMARFGAAMAFDAVRKVAVLFGGWGAPTPSTNGPLGDTWTWNGAAWTEQHPAHNPAPRAFAAMAFDDARGVVVMFGGQGVATTYGATWTWNGTDWTLQDPAHGPSPRRYAAMAYDAARQNVVLFGGSLPGIRYADTWTWDGRDWTAHHPVNSPVGRALADLAYDDTVRKTMLFGGLDVGNMPLGDTWTWDGQVWSAESPSTSPGPRIGQGTAYDAEAGAVIIFGGVASQATNDLWSWDGTNWSQR